MTNDVEDFIAAARSFLDWIDRGDLTDLKDAHVLLARLQYGVLSLDDTEPETVVNVPDEDGNVDRKVRARLAALPFDMYRAIYNPLSEKDDAPVVGSLLDDLADIARDLRKGFAALRAGSPGDAIWEWRFGYDWHWGRHATHAQSAIWAYLAGLE